MHFSLRRIVLPLFAILSCFGLSSCLELYTEEMVIHPDLSGEAVVTVKLPDTLISKFDAVQDEFAPAKIKKRFDAASGVTLKSYSISEGRHPEAVFRVSFSSLEKLSAAAAANSPAQLLIGEFKISTDEDGKRRIERQLGKGKPTAELPADGYANYKIHFDQPMEVVGTNSEYKDTSHGDVRYRWPIATIAEQQPLIVNRTSKALPWLIILISLAVLLLATWIGWLKFGQIQRKKKLAASMPVAPPHGAPMPAAPQGPQRPGPPRRPGPPQA